uniref:Uncharacterized protein n=1 Tax=Glossina austeni TaxID=7395 RepID=A0A1A9VQH5_GLOAU
MCMFVICMLCTEKRKGSTSSNGHTNRDAVSKTAFPVCVKKRTSSSSYSYSSASFSASTNCPSALSSFAAVTTNNYVDHTLVRVGTTTTQTPSQLEDTAQIMSAERLSKAIYNDYPKSTSSTALCQDLSSYRVWL